MAFRFNFELVVSDTALKAIKEYQIDCTQIAIDAIYEKIKCCIEAQVEFERIRMDDLREELRMAKLKLQQKEAIRQEEKDLRELTSKIQGARTRFKGIGMRQPLIIGS